MFGDHRDASDAYSSTLPGRVQNSFHEFQKKAGSAALPQKEGVISIFELSLICFSTLMTLE